jgi:membrane protease YdiL (CAAX protease family)
MYYIYSMNIDSAQNRPQNTWRLSAGKTFLFVAGCLAIFVFTAFFCGLLTFWIPVNVVKITIRELLLRMPLTIIALHLFAGKVLKLYSTKSLYGRISLIKTLNWILISLLLPLSVWSFYYFGHFAVPYTHTIVLPDASKLVIIVKWTAISIAAGITEEILFRGHLLLILQSRHPAWKAVLLSSFIFGLVHIAMLTAFEPLDIVIVVIGGIIAGTMFALIYRYTRVIWYAAIVHVIWDIFFIGKIVTLSADQTDANQAILAFKLTTQKPWLTGRNFGIEAGLPCLTIYLIVITTLYLLSNVLRRRLPDAKNLAT